MKKLTIDLEELVQSFVFDKDEYGKEYLDTITGEIINIPNDVNRVIEGNLEESELSDWEKELLTDARVVKTDEDYRYICIPTIPIDYFQEGMEGYAYKAVVDEKISTNLQDSLKTDFPMREFKNVLHNFSEELEKWYLYEDERIEKYVIEWLKENEIEVDCK